MTTETQNQTAADLAQLCKDLRARIDMLDAKEQNLWGTYLGKKQLTQAAFDNWRENGTMARLCSDELTALLAPRMKEKVE